VVRLLCCGCRRVLVLGSSAVVRFGRVVVGGMRRGGGCWLAAAAVRRSSCLAAMGGTGAGDMLMQQL
jgi:hypothetical protein